MADACERPRSVGSSATGPHQELLGIVRLLGGGAPVDQEGGEAWPTFVSRSLVIN